MPKLIEEQILQARSVDLLEYLQTHEPDSIRKIGNEHFLVEHDSFKLSNGKWFWYSRGFGGRSCLDFLVKVRGIHFKKAVQMITEGCCFPQNYKNSIPKEEPTRPPLKPFKLPKPNKNNDRVIAYLRGRGINKEVINRCIEIGILYESEKSHRCVFVGKDGDTPKFACERGTIDDLKKDISGSKKKYGFILPPKNSMNNKVLAIFESPVDCLAHFSIHEVGQTKWDGFRLSLGGVSSLALMNFLENNPGITNIQLCLDFDNAGRDAVKRIITELLNDKRFSKVKITVTPPPIGKDYADTAKAIQQLHIEKSKTINRSNEAVF